MYRFAKIFTLGLVTMAASVSVKADPIAAILSDSDVREGWLQAPDPDPFLTLALVAIGLLGAVVLHSRSSRQLRSHTDD